MTRADHPSGSDRIYEALRTARSSGPADRSIINVQGDLPTIPADDIRAVATAGRSGGRHRHPRGRDPLEEERTEPERRQGDRHPARRAAAARALLHPRHRALRRGAALPSHRPLRLSPRRARALRRLPPSPLEKRERLEQLRALEAGMRIDIAVVDDVPLGVDTPHDLERARASSTIRTARIPQRQHDARRSPSRASPAPTPIIACREAYPGREPLPCPTFEDAFAAIPPARPISA